MTRAQTAPGGDSDRGDEMNGTIAGPVVPDPDAAPLPTPTPLPKQFGPRVTRSLSSPSLPARVVISEFRLSGPGGSTDEFIELANTTSASIDLTGWTLVASTVTTPLSPLNLSGKRIPAGGHLLLVNSGAYSLNALTAGDTSYTGDIDPASTLSLSDASGTVVDAVGNLWAIAAPPSASDQYAYVRRLESGVPADSGNDSDDFNLVDTGATASTTDGTGVGPLTTARLGAPGPQNSQSPIQRNGQVTLVPINAATFGTPSDGRYASKGSLLDSPNGRQTLRRTITNNSGALVTQMRFRIVAATGGTSSASGVADLRALTSAGVTVNGTKVVQGITLDVPSVPTVVPGGFGANAASAGNGGGLNSSWTVDLSSTSALLLTDGTSAAGGIPAGKSINVEFLFAIVQNGSYRVVVDTELVNAPEPVSTPDVALECLDDDGNSVQSVGAGILNDDARQTLSSVVLPGGTQFFLARIKNSGQTAAAFHLNLSGLPSSSGAATPWNPSGWTGHATLGGQTSDIFAALQNTSGWTTPVVAPGEEAVVKLSLTAPTSTTPPVASGSFRLVAQSGDKGDAVVGQVTQMAQSIGGVEYSLDAGTTWTPVPESGVLVPQWSVLGLRALRSNPNLPWPDEPFKPQWTRGEDSFVGEEVWLHFPDVTASDSSGESVSVECGNVVSTQVRVTPQDN